MPEETVNLKQELKDVSDEIAGTKKVEAPIIKEEVKEEKIETVVEPVVDEAEAARVAEAERIAAEEHSEQSKFGRIITRHTKPLESKIDQIFESIEELKASKVAPVVEEPEPILPEDATREEIQQYTKAMTDRAVRMIEQKEAAKTADVQKQKGMYAREYNRLIKESLDPDENPEVYQMMTDRNDLTYNQIHKGDPKEDFLINFRNATKAFIGKVKTATPTVLKSQTAKVSVPGVNVPGQQTVGKKLDREAMLSKLDPYERDIARALKDEDLQQIMARY